MIDPISMLKRKAGSGFSIKANLNEVVDYYKFKDDIKDVNDRILEDLNKLANICGVCEYNEKYGKQCIDKSSEILYFKIKINEELQSDIDYGKCYPKLLLLQDYLTRLSNITYANLSLDDIHKIIIGDKWNASIETILYDIETHSDLKDKVRSVIKFNAFNEVDGIFEFISNCLDFESRPIAYTEDYYRKIFAMADYYGKLNETKKGFELWLMQDSLEMIYLIDYDQIPMYVWTHLVLFYLFVNVKYNTPKSVYSEDDTSYNGIQDSLFQLAKELYEFEKYSDSSSVAESLLKGTTLIKERNTLSLMSDELLSDISTNDIRVHSIEHSYESSRHEILSNVMSAESNLLYKDSLDFVKDFNKFNYCHDLGLSELLRPDSLSFSSTYSELEDLSGKSGLTDILISMLCDKIKYDSMRCEPYDIINIVCNNSSGDLSKELDKLLRYVKTQPTSQVTIEDILVSIPFLCDRIMSSLPKLSRVIISNIFKVIVFNNFAVGDVISLNGSVISYRGMDKPKDKEKLTNDVSIGKVFNEYYGCFYNHTEKVIHDFVDTSITHDFEWGRVSIKELYVKVIGEDFRSLKHFEQYERMCVFVRYLRSQDHTPRFYITGDIILNAIKSPMGALFEFLEIYDEVLIKE